MAATTEDVAALVVTLEANLTKYSKQMEKVADITATALKQAEQKVIASNDNMARGAEAGAARQKRAYDSVGQSATAMADLQQKALRQTQAGATNMSSQFQDIAVQLQSGTSPLTIALQQGTQLGQVLQQTAQSGGGLFKALGAAAGAFLNPVTAATVAVIALGGYALKAFNDIRTGSKLSNEEVEKHVAALIKAADTYSSVLSPAVREYLQSLEDANTAQERQAQGAALVQQSVDKLSTKILDLSGVAVGAMDLLPPDQQRTIQAASNQIEQLNIDLSEGRVSAGDMGQAIDLIIATMRTLTQTKGVEDYIKALEDARKSLVNMATDVKTATKAKEELSKAGNADLKAFDDSMKQLRAIGLPALNELERAMKAYGDAVIAAKNNQELLAKATAEAAPIMATALQNLNTQFKSSPLSTSSLSDTVKIIGQIESGMQNLGKHGAASTASGIFGFTDKTWIATLRTFEQFKDKKLVSDKDLLAMKGMADVQQQAAERLVEINQRLLQNAGKATSDMTAVMSHWLGAGGAMRVLDEIGTGRTDFLAPSTLQNHKELAGKTAEEIIQIVQAKMDRAKIEVGITPKVKEDELQAAITRIQEKVAADLAEAKAVGELSDAVDVEAFTREKVRTQMELLAIARRDGSEANAEEKKQIDAVAESAGIAAGRITDYSASQKQLGKDTKEAAKTQEQLAAEARANAQQFAQLGGQFINTFISGLEQGKSATEALKDALADLANQLLQMALNKALLGIGNQLFGVPGNAQGGLAGSGPRRQISPLAFVGAPRFAAGGMVGPGEIPSILHKGEVVIPARMVRQAMHMPASSAAGGGSTVNVGNIAINTSMEGRGDVKADTQRGKEFGQKVQAMIQLELARQSRPGGMLTAAGSSGRVGR